MKATVSHCKPAVWELASVAFKAEAEAEAGIGDPPTAHRRPPIHSSSLISADTLASCLLQHAATVAVAAAAAVAAAVMGITYPYIILYLVAVLRTGGVLL